MLASVLAFGALFGLIGAIIGVPIAAGLQILVEELTAAGERESPPRTPRSGSSRPDRMAPADSGREFDYGAAVYGSVLVTALVGATFEADFDARSMTLSVFTTTVVFWLAHVWSEVMGVRLAGTVPQWGHVWHVAVSEWPVVEAGLVPDALLALAWAGVYSRDTGAELALIAAILQLAAWGFAAGWRTQHRVVPAIVTGVVDCAFGLAIVGLEVAIH